MEPVQILPKGISLAAYDISFAAGAAALRVEHRTNGPVRCRAEPAAQLRSTSFVTLPNGALDRLGQLHARASVMQQSMRQLYVDGAAIAASAGILHPPAPNQQTNMPDRRLYAGPCCNPGCVFKPRPWTVFHPAKNVPGKQVCAASACLFWAGNRDTETRNDNRQERGTGRRKRGGKPWYQALSAPFFTFLIGFLSLYV